MKISYAITVKDELNELQRLVNFLIDWKRTEDEIVTLYDSKGGSEAVEEWTLKGAFITSADFGELDWGDSGEAMTISLTLAVDYCILSVILNSF